MAASRIPVYSRHATSRDQVHYIVRALSLSKAKAAIAAGELRDVSVEADRKRGRLTCLQQCELDRASFNSPAAINRSEMERNAEGQRHAVAKVNAWGALNAAMFAKLTVEVNACATGL